jgi:hypothetical protein
MLAAALLFTAMLASGLEQAQGRSPYPEVHAPADPRD